MTTIKKRIGRLEQRRNPGSGLFAPDDPLAYDPNLEALAKIFRAEGRDVGKPLTLSGIKRRLDGTAAR